MRIEQLASVDSTNAELVRRIRAAGAGAVGDLVLTADFQSAGRGRQGRSWTAAPGSSLMFSMFVQPPAGAQAWSLATLVAATAIATGVEVYTDAAGGAIGCEVKWPNDLLIKGRKFVGILAELVPGTGVVVGAGINTAMTETDLAAIAHLNPAATQPTSLNLAAGIEVDRHALLSEVADKLDQAMARWRSGADPLTDYRRRCVTIGQTVRVSLPDGSSLTGRTRTVDRAGRLVVATEGGEQVVAAGDVTHVRLV